MIIIGLDYGKRFIGVAVAESNIREAEPTASVSASKGVPNWSQMDQVIESWQPGCLVLGYPLNMDGTSQKLTQAVIKFKTNLEARYQLPVHLCDERLTTFAAKQQGPKNKAELDAMAASIILQQWLDETR